MTFSVAVVGRKGRDFFRRRGFPVVYEAVNIFQHLKFEDAEAIALAVDEVPQSAPGERFVYSDINFFLLADIVARASGMPFDRFVKERVFAPLGMAESMFNPPDALKARIAPTEVEAGQPVRGVVHDPRARPGNHHETRRRHLPPAHRARAVQHEHRVARHGRRHAPRDRTSPSRRCSTSRTAPARASRCRARA